MTKVAPDPTGNPFPNGGSDPIPCCKAPAATSSYINLPTQRAALVKWARTVDLVGVQEIRATLQK
jgi:hypothetical protein